MIGARPLGEWLGAPRYDLPLGRDPSGRFLPWIVGLMVYLAALGGTGMILLGDALRDWNRSLTGTLTLQLPAETSAARLDMTLAVLRQTGGVVSTQLLDQAETARLLEPWLGQSVPIELLPLPRLVDVRIDPDTAIDYDGLLQRLNQVVPEARLDDHRLWLGRLRSFALRIQTIIAAVVAMVIVLMLLSVVFVASTGLAIHQQVIELLHLLGAGEAYIARQFQVQALRLGLIGGAIGVAAAVATLFVVAAAADALDLPPQLGLTGIWDWRLWVLLPAVAIGAALAAMVTARVAVQRRLARMP